MRRLFWLAAAGLVLTLGAPRVEREEVECDPSYPGICIPPPPPDLDCADVPQKSFRVIGDDPHGFDADSDGVGCEPYRGPR